MGTRRTGRSPKRGLPKPGASFSNSAQSFTFGRRLGLGTTPRQDTPRGDQGVPLGGKYVMRIWGAHEFSWLKPWGQEDLFHAASPPPNQNSSQNGSAKGMRSQRFPSHQANANMGGLKADGAASKPTCKLKQAVQEECPVRWVGLARSRIRKAAPTTPTHHPKTHLQT